MATNKYQKKIYDVETYGPGCGRPSVHTRNRSYAGQCRVFVYLITDIQQLTTSENHSILYELSANDFDNSIGVYFYRFDNNDEPFLKIGECSDRSIIQRFSRGWDLKGKTNNDSYIYRQSKNKLRGKERFMPMYHGLEDKLSKDNPAYFVFYEVVAEEAAPKIDELVAEAKHLHNFNAPTVQGGSSISPYGTGSNLVWHSDAFDEVLRKELPSGSPYPV